MNRNLPNLLNSFVDTAESTLFFKSKDSVWDAGQLFEHVTKWASFLSESGVKRGDRVGIYLKKSLEEIAATFAISMVGGVFVNIHPGNKFQQLQHIINDCDIEVLISSKERLRSLGQALQTLQVWQIISVDDASDVIKFREIGSFKTADSLPAFTRDKTPRLLDDDIATILYTSGSTGKPKGIIQTHGNLVEGAEIVSSYVQNVREDRLLSVLPFSFDYGLNQLLSAIYKNFSLVLQDYLFPLDLVKALQREQITGLAGVPTIWLDLLKVLEKHPETQLPHLRYITNSGGKMYAATVNKLRERLPQTDIYLMYGLTEAFRSTFLPPAEVDQRPESIGKAIPNVEIFVIDDEGRECAPGEVGEIVHRGALIAKGYWGNPQKTNEVYRPNPLLPEWLGTSEKVVYSGDLGWKDDEGFLYIVGRKDNMIKSSGHRISPDEITEVLLKMDGVSNAAVIGVEDEQLGHKVAAFLQIDANREISIKECQTFVKKFLPAHMIPSIVMCLKKFPQNGNGKVNLTALRTLVTTPQTTIG